MRHDGLVQSLVGQLDGPMDVAVDSQGRFVVAEYDAHRVKVIDVDRFVTLCYGSYGRAAAGGS